MAQLRQDYDEFVKRNVEIISVGPENARKFKQYFEDNDLPFVGLPDPHHSVLKLYGQQVKIFKFGRMPGQIVIDKQGMVRFVHYGHSMSDIPENSDVLETLKSLNQETQE